jgi:hypothetical protein
MGKGKSWKAEYCQYAQKANNVSRCAEENRRGPESTMG